MHRMKTNLICLARAHAAESGASVRNTLGLFGVETMKLPSARSGMLFTVGILNAKQIP